MNAIIETVLYMSYLARNFHITRQNNLQYQGTPSGTVTAQAKQLNMYIYTSTHYKLK